MPAQDFYLSRPYKPASGAPATDFEKFQVAQGYEQIIFSSADLQKNPTQAQIVFDRLMAAYRLSADKGSKAVDVLGEFGAVNNTTIEEAIAKAVERNLDTIVINSSTDVILTRPIPASVARMTFTTNVKGSFRLVQSTYGLPVFDVTADNVTISNFRMFNDQPKARIINYITGYEYNSRVPRDYSSGVVSRNCNATKVVNCDFEKFVTGATFFGYDNEDESLLVRGKDHVFSNNTTLYCDMGILAYLTDSMLCSGNIFRDIEWTQPTAPPHGSYFSVKRLSDLTYPINDNHVNLIYVNNTCINNNFSSGHKLKACNDFVFIGCVSVNCERGADIDFCKGGIISNFSIPSLSEYVWPTAATHPQFPATSTDQLRYNGGVDNDSQCSGLNIVDSIDITATGVSINKDDINDSDGVLIRQGENGIPSRVKVKDLKVTASNQITYSQYDRKNMLLVPDLAASGAVDIDDDYLVTRADPVTSTIPDGCPVVLYQPLPNSTLPGGLSADTVYFTKQSTLDTNGVELHSTAALNSKVNITSAGTGQLKIIAGVVLPAGVSGNTISLGSGVTASSIYPNGTLVCVKARGTLPGGFLERQLYYTQASGSTISFYYDSARTQQVTLSSSGSGVLQIHNVGVPSGYGLHISAGVDCTIDDAEFLVTGIEGVTAAVPGGINATTSEITFTPLTYVAYKDRCPVTVSISAGGTLPTGLTAGRIYYPLTDLKLNKVQLFNDPACTSLVTLTANGSGTLTIAGLSPALNRHIRFGAGSLRCKVRRYTYYGTNRHGQIESGALDNFISVNRNSMSSSNWYSASWTNNEDSTLAAYATGARAQLDDNNTPIVFSSNNPTPSVGDFGVNYATNTNSTYTSTTAAGVLDLISFSGPVWDGRRMTLFSRDALTRIVTSSISRTSSANVNATNDDINLGQPVADLFPDGTPVYVSSTGGLGGGLSSTTLYYTKVSASGPNFVSLCTTPALTTVVNITSTGGGTTTIRSAASDHFLLSNGARIYTSSRTLGRSINFTFSTTEAVSGVNSGKWVQTGGTNLTLSSRNVAYDNLGTAISNSVAKTAVGTLVIPADSLLFVGSWLDFRHIASLLNNTGGTTTYNLSIELNGSAIFTADTATISASSNARNVQLLGTLVRMSETTANLTVQNIVGSASGIASPGSGSLSNAAIVGVGEGTQGFTFNFKQSNTLIFYVTLSTASSSYTYTPRYTTSRNS